MGRIAEALKKAQCDRETKRRVSSEERGVGVLDQAVEAIGSKKLRDSPAGPPWVDGDAATARTGRGALTGGRIAARGFGGDSAGPSWNVHPNLVAWHDRTSAVAEQYRSVRTWLTSRCTIGGGACLGVTSSVPREGKSVTVGNLSVVMSEIRHLEVLAVDADFRQSALAGLFKMPNSPGLADVLAGRAALSDAIARTPVGNLSLLAAGLCHDVSPAELLNSTMAARVFSEIRERFGFILVDTPPVQKLSDVGVIGSLCSGLIMVVRMHKTASHIVRQSVERLKANNLNIIGCLATGCAPRDAQFEYDRAAEE